jgi:hypothetical protein
MKQSTTSEHTSRHSKLLNQELRITLERKEKDDSGEASDLYILSEALSRGDRKKRRSLIQSSAKSEVVLHRLRRFHL